MILLILLDSQHELWDSSELALLEDCREKNRQGQDDDDDDDDVHDDNDDDDNDEDDDDDNDDDGVDNDDDNKEAETEAEEDAEMTVVFTEGDTRSLSWRRGRNRGVCSWIKISLKLFAPWIKLG